jgi:glycosyltransferase involved in cell wall biosynthesis
MACRTPVVASAVGGITEVVVHGETGLLVPFEFQSDENSEPRNPVQFSKDLASAANSLLQSPAKIEQMGTLSRKRVEDRFSWQSIARRTMAFYKSLAGIEEL